ncbi:UNVERIFIED_CONTAM: hypothetical protein Slati_0988900 [Sesamum latifolium]|uniref:RNA-directed DNA polymerase (Reverse transcriptase) n=1 Tax=Sesamum latifolium TaxID=2727402 RepID=A0AAW2XUE0_9LAMI
MPVTSCGMTRLEEKLKRLKQHLRQWNKDIFRNIFENIKTAEEVAVAEQNFDENSIDANLISMNQSTTLLQQALITKENFWHHNAACKWMCDGERNTKYFHSMVKKKRSHTAITSILHEGASTMDPTLIRATRVEFFHSLL